MAGTFIPMSADQQRLLVDAGHQYEQWLFAKRASLRFEGWMSWREKKGTDYLISGKSGGHSQKSHGARSFETEEIYRTFTNSKEQTKQALDSIQSRLAERAPMLKAIRLGRILAPLAQVIREYDVQGLLGRHLLVTGTHAIAAYEALAGQFFDSSLMATEDLDFIWYAGQNVELLVKENPPALLKHLKSVDSSYTVNTERTFQARNSKGLVIDFISDDIGAATAPKEYLKPIAIQGQHWLFNASHIEAVAVDTTGLPVKLVVPDPRMYCLHKAWVSDRADRNPLKKHKDLGQAKAVSQLVSRHLPQYPFDEFFVSNLDRELRNSFETHIRAGLKAASMPSDIRM